MFRNSRKDKLRFQQITEILTQPFEDLEFLAVSDKVAMMMQPEKYPIYRRRINRKITVYGLWWMNESQWTRYLSAHHNNGIVLKTGQDPDRLLTSRTFKADTMCWIRDMGDHVDLEGIALVGMWDPIKKRTIGAKREWLTVSITREEYKRLDEYLGPREDGCRHNEEDLSINKG